jgi:hypothetical protein
MNLGKPKSTEWINKNIIKITTDKGVIYRSHGKITCAEIDGESYIDAAIMSILSQKWQKRIVANNYHIAVLN